MLFGETVTVYCDNHTEHTNILLGQNAEYVKAGGTYSNHWALNGFSFKSFVAVHAGNYETLASCAIHLKDFTLHN
jgi:hypothetical protein